MGFPWEQLVFVGLNVSICGDEKMLSTNNINSEPTFITYYQRYDKLLRINPDTREYLEKKEELHQLLLRLSERATQ